MHQTQKLPTYKNKLLTQQLKKRQFLFCPHDTILFKGNQIILLVY